MSEIANNTYQKTEENKQMQDSVSDLFQNARIELIANRYPIGMFALAALTFGSVYMLLTIDIFYAQKLIPAFIIIGIVLMQRLLSRVSNSINNENPNSKN